MKRWIWQQENYPNFTYDNKKLEDLIQRVSLTQGYLIALSETMDREIFLQRQFEALMSETISSAAIEGETLNRDSVKTSIQRKLGLKNIDYNNIDDVADGLVKVLIEANTNYKEDLSQERLFGWHNALFPKGYSGFHKINVASFRGDADMEVVGTLAGKDEVFYEAPPRANLEQEMQKFLDWFNITPPSLLKAAIAHLWFVIIHPFDDGNGRIARAITDLVLSNIENSNISRLYSMSSAIYKDRKSYYKALENTTGYIRKKENHLDITFWCEWFFTTLYVALDETKKKFGYIVQKTKFWDIHKNSSLNSRQIKVLNFILDIGIEEFKGNLSKKKYMSIADTASTTASRDITELIELGCIKQKEGTSGRSVSYEIVL